MRMVLNRSPLEILASKPRRQGIVPEHSSQTAHQVHADSITDRQRLCDRNLHSSVGEKEYCFNLTGRYPQLWSGPSVQRVAMSHIEQRLECRRAIHCEFMGFGTSPRKRLPPR